MKFVEKALIIILISAFSSLAGASEIYKRSTQWDITDKGFIIYLDRHELDCEKGVMSYFKMHREYDNNGPTDRVQFRYTCIGINGLGRSSLFNTYYAGYNGRHSVNDLDQHDVRCPDGQVLQKFKISRNHQGNKLRYDYKCARAETLCCRYKSSTVQDMGDKSFFYLDRQEAGAYNSPYWALSQFRLVSDNYNRKLNYSYKICKLKDLDAERELKQLKQDEVEFEKNIPLLRKRYTLAHTRYAMISRQLSKFENDLEEQQLLDDKLNSSFGRRTKPNFGEFRKKGIENAINSYRILAKDERIRLEQVKLNYETEQKKLKTTKAAIESFSNHPGLNC